MIHQGRAWPSTLAAVVALLWLGACAGARPASTARPPTTEPPEGHGATATGVPEGVALQRSGTVVVTTRGAVVDALDVDGAIEVRASDVTIRRTRVRSHDVANGLILIGPGVSGTTIEDTEVDGMQTSVAGIVASYHNDHLTVRRVDVHGVVDGIQLGPYTLIEDSTVHDLGGDSSAHFDGITSDGDGSNSTIRNNTIAAPQDQTSAIMIDTYFGPQSNITIEGNLLSGGGYPLYVLNQGHGDPAGVVITRNAFVAGQWGYASINCPVAGSANTDAESGQEVPV